MDDNFRCIACGAVRYWPPAGYDDADCIDGRMVSCGNPLCQDCARAGMSCPEYARYVTDGGPVGLVIDARALATGTLGAVGLWALMAGGLVL